MRAHTHTHTHTQSLFVDNAKLLRKIRNHKDCEELQNDINKIYKWSKTWEIKFNVRKCEVLTMGKSTVRRSWTHSMLGLNVISMVKEEKALGVEINHMLSSKKHVNRIFGGTNSGYIRNIRTVFHFLIKDMMRKKIIITMI